MVLGVPILVISDLRNVLLLKSTKSQIPHTNVGELRDSLCASSTIFSACFAGLGARHSQISCAFSGLLATRAARDECVPLHHLARISSVVRMMSSRIRSVGESCRKFVEG